MTDKQIIKPRPICLYEDTCLHLKEKTRLCKDCVHHKNYWSKLLEKEQLEKIKSLEQECEELKKKIKEIKNVLSISYDLWMYHIANGIGNSDNKNAIEALEDFSVAIRLLADTLGESEGYLSYSTNKSKIYEQRKGLLQKINEVQL